MTNRIQIGGASGIIAALTFLFGMAYYVMLLAENQYGNLNGDLPAQLTYLANHQSMIHLWYFVIYVVFGFALLGMQIGLNAFLDNGALSQACRIVAYLWVGLVIAAGMVANVGNEMSLTLLNSNHPNATEMAITAWLNVQILVNGLGGGNEIVGGVWLALFFLASKTTSFIPNIARLGALVVGLCGVVTAVPALSELGAVFGLGCILWFLSVGLFMLLNRDA